MRWLETIFRTLLFWLDSIVYKFIPTVYNLLVNIAETSIFSEDVFTLFSNRIYTLLGVFMLFKVSFSILTYIVDPDAFTDKNKGFGKLISNIIITLVLLILTPFIFTYAMELQGIILKDNLIGKLFSTNGVNTTVVADPGNTMAYETFKAFYYFDVDRYKFNFYEEGDPGYTSQCVKAVASNINFDCVKSIEGIDDDSLERLKKNLTYSHHTSSINVYMDVGIAIMRDSNDDYVMTYTSVFSTLTGVVMILLLIVFCFDIAVRGVKLGFLRMLAPVPIISRIDPKKGKEVFDKWVKTCMSTYFDLFIRLLAIYFAIFVITQIIDLRFTDAVTGQEIGQINPFVKVFIILGALLFAKQLPKLISDLTGVKMDGKFTLNPMSKLREVPLVGAGVTTAAALAGGAYTGYKAGVQAGHPGRGLFQGMMGARREIKGKVPLMGAEKGAKSPRALNSGMQAGYKEITGKDYTHYSPWKNIGHDYGQSEIDDLKNQKYAIQGEQAKLDAQLQSFYDQLTKAKTAEERDKINKAIEVNRSIYGKYSKNISSIDDQIKDIKRLYHIDDSPKKDVDEARKAAGKILAGTQPRVSVELTNQSEQENFDNVVEQIYNDLGMENIDSSPSLSDDNYFESIVKEIDSDSNNNKSD